MMFLGIGKKYMLHFLTTKNVTPEEKLLEKPCLFSRKKNLMKFTEEQLFH